MVIKRILITAIVTLGIAMMLPTEVNAQAASQSGIRVFPSVIYYDQNPGTEVESTVTVYNNTGKELVFQVEPINIVKSPDNTTLESYPLDINVSLLLSSNKLTIPNEQQQVLKITSIVPSDVLSADTLPAIRFSELKRGGEQVNFQQAIVVPIIPKFTADIPYDLDLLSGLNPGSFNFTPQVSFSNKLTNLQNRHFVPAARVEVWKGGQRLSSETLVDIPGSLTPRQTYRIDYDLDYSEFAPLQYYQLRFILSEASTGREFVRELPFVYIPIITVFTICSGILMLVVAAVVLYVMRDRLPKINLPIDIKWPKKKTN